MVNPGLRLRDALRRDDAGADGAPARPARRPGTRMNADRLYGSTRPVPRRDAHRDRPRRRAVRPALFRRRARTPSTGSSCGACSASASTSCSATPACSRSASRRSTAPAASSPPTCSRARAFRTCVLALVIGTVAAAAVGYLVGLVALRRTGIYFAMITVAIAEVFYFVEFNPLSEWTGGENGLPGVPTPTLDLGFTTMHFTSGWSLYPFLAFCYFVGIVDRAAHRALAGRRRSSARSARIRCAPPPSGTTSTATSSPRSSSPPRTRASPAGCSACCRPSCRPTPSRSRPRASSSCRPPSAAAARCSVRCVGAAVWLFLQDFLQATLKLGATWKLVLGLGLRAPRLLPAPGHHRRRPGPLTASSRRQVANRRAPQPAVAPTAGGAAHRAPRRRRMHHAQTRLTAARSCRPRA